MGERLSTNPLEAELLGDRSLQDWHSYLTTTKDGEPSGHLGCPGSRYGSTSEDCAWFAIAVQCVYAHSNGIDDPLEGSLDYFMGLCVNDNDSVADLLQEHWYAVPDCLKEMIGDDRE